MSARCAQCGRPRARRARALGERRPRDLPRRRRHAALGVGARARDAARRLLRDGQSRLPHAVRLLRAQSAVGPAHHGGLPAHAALAPLVLDRARRQARRRRRWRAARVRGRVARAQRGRHRPRHGDDARDAPRLLREHRAQPARPTASSSPRRRARRRTRSRRAGRSSRRRSRLPPHADLPSLSFRPTILPELGDAPRRAARARAARARRRSPSTARTRRRSTRATRSSSAPRCTRCPPSAPSTSTSTGSTR